MKNICIGLFGTCDNSDWRDEFIEGYTNRKIDFFNPDAGDNWHPGLIELENEHLQTDEIILFPVLSESLGTGSLGEIGFSVLNSIRNIRNGSGQYLIVMIDDDCTDDRKTEAERQNSIKLRKLVKSKLIEVNHPNIIVISSITEMFDASMELLELISNQMEFRLAYDISTSSEQNRASL